MADDADSQEARQAPFAVGDPDARGYIWYVRASIPWAPFTVPVPVAHMDRKPREGWESSTFTYTPATKWDEHWVALDVPIARRAANALLEGFLVTRELPLLP